MEHTRMEGAADWRERLLRPVWAEVDLDAIAHNVRRIIALSGPSVRLFAALKGDGYGHGCVQSARVVLESGAHGVALANLDECLQIREDGITAPVLLYAGTPSYLASTVVRLQITPTVTDFDAALAFSRVAPDGYGVFVKVDCGLERAGVYAEEALQLVLAVSRLPRIRIAGLYTHMHSGSGSDEYARWQFSRFDALLRQVDQVGIHVPIKLAASSPFIGRYPEMLLNAIDPGHLVFGLPAGQETTGALGLKPALQALKTRLVQTRTARPRTCFVDEVLFETKNTPRFGLLPIGWGDGLHRGYGRVGPALVAGKRTTILGPVHYEHSRVDLTNLPQAQVGDEVVLLGQQDQQCITVDEIASLCNILPAQVTGTLSKHMPIVYFRGCAPSAIVYPARRRDTEPL